ncbi:MAG: hypothetical protein HY671_09015 [Chloroflexi bacterium]|nr:hypothetical protein [Chloroflexota bacterium]
MKKANFILGVVSLAVGVVLVGASLAAGMRWLGLIMGSLLMLNGLARLWLARQSLHQRTDSSQAVRPTKQESALTRRDQP